MKTLNLKSKIADKKTLHDLVRVVCKATKGAELKVLKDKHKMVTNVTTGSLFTFCKDLKLKLTFDLTTAKPEVIVQIEVPNDFNPAEEVLEGPSGSSGGPGSIGDNGENKKAPEKINPGASDDDSDPF